MPMTCLWTRYNAGMRRAFYFFILALLATGSTLFVQAQPDSFDVLIRNGRVMEGSGNPWLRADVGIRGATIALVGDLRGARATRTIDAADRLVTPGFIDVHTHAGEGLTRPELRQARPVLAQGVTTLVINPDGGGPLDLAAQRTALERGGIGPNVALLIGHATVRRALLENATRAPTPAELDRMKQLVRTAMEQGAFGLSSGLFYVPGSYAKTEEVIALASVVGEFGGVYTSHIRDEGNYSVGLLAAVEEVIRIADEGRLVGIVTHMKALGPESWGLATAVTVRIEAARTRGVQVFADQYPYEASSTSLRAALAPDNAEPTPKLVGENLKRRGGADSIVLAFYKPDPSLEGQSLAQIAKARGVSPEAAAIELLKTGNPSIVSFNMQEEDIRHIMRKPYTMASSDGGLVMLGEGKPHPRFYGAFARRLAVYARERRVVDLEFAIRSMTSLPAAVFGMRDRGVIREGAAADLAIFDPEQIHERSTYTDPHQLADGMSYVLVNGVVVIDDGKFTDALPGRVLSRTPARSGGD